MTGSLPGFGGAGYSSQESRALSSISEGPAPDLSQGQEEAIKLLQRHDYQLKFLAAQMKQTQTGVNEANQNPIQQIQQFVADIIILLGGGELATGALDFGDLQYILPALGALFGFGDGPFPISLFEAAEKFFLGYVVPNAQFVDVINGIIQAWLGTLGVDPEFISDIKALITAFGDLFDGLGNLLPSLDQLFGALGVSGADLGPLGQLLAPIINLFTDLDITQFGNMIEFITDAISPFIESLTAVINWVNSILAVFGFDGGDVVNNPLGDTSLPFANLLGFLGDINFASPDFNPLEAAATFITTILSPTGLLASFSDIAAAIAEVVNGIIQQIIDTLFGGLTSSNSEGNPIEALSLVLQQLQAGVTNAVNSSANVFSLVTQFGGIIQQLVDGLPGSPDYVDADDFLEQLGTVSGTLVGTAFGAAADLLAGFAGMLNAWYGGSAGTGAPADPIQTIESIRVLTKDGYTLQTFTSSDPTWTTDAGLLAATYCKMGVIGGGGKGATGAVVGSTVAYASGGFGGTDGGYTLVDVDPATLASTLAIVIGAAATTAGANGGTSSISSGGSPLAVSTPGISGIATPEGYQATSSQPGSGGNGGLGFTVSGTQAAADPGTPGEASATAAGGAGGSGGAGSNGATGATGGLPISGGSGGLPISGGSGGGGGGGRTGFALTGYAGGNGGYPGGGSGGGGGVGSTGGGGTGGAGGTPAAGFAFIIWK